MRNLIVFTWVVFIISGCKKDPTTWDVDALIPLMKTKMTLQKAISDSMIGEGINRELSFIYKGKLLDFSLDSAFTVPDTTMEDEFYLPVGTVTLQPGQTFKADTITSPYNIRGIQAVEVWIDRGKFFVYLENTIQGEFVLDYSIPNMTKNGNKFFVRETVPAGSPDNPVKLSKSYDLSGYEISLTGPNNNQFNQMTTEYRLYVDTNGVPVTITPGDKLLMGNKLVDITPNYARGYFGSKVVSGDSTSPLDAFRNIVGGTIDFEQASMDFLIKNEIGVDVEVTISNLWAYNKHHNNEVGLTGPIINNKLNLNRATETGNSANPVNPSVYTVQMDNSNSNVVDFIGNLPTDIGYDIEVFFNPLGNVSNSNDFVYDSTGIFIDLDAEIPFKFNASSLTLVDTSDFSIDSTSQDETKKITGGALNILTNNWYPFSLGMQFYLLDENYTVIDSVFDTPQVINPGIPVSGKVVQPTFSTISASVSDTKIDNLYRTKYMITQMRLNTPGTDKIQIYSNYLIDIKMVGDFTYMITVE